MAFWRLALFASPIPHDRTGTPQVGSVRDSPNSIARRLAPPPVFRPRPSGLLFKDGPDAAWDAGWGLDGEQEIFDLPEALPTLRPVAQKMPCRCPVCWTAAGKPGIFTRVGWHMRSEQKRIL